MQIHRNFILSITLGVLITLSNISSALAADPGFIGMQVQGVSNKIAAALGMPNAKGVMVRNIALQGPAAKAGFHRGDLITRFNETPITTFEELIGAVQRVKPNQTVKVTVQRSSGDKELVLTAGVWSNAWKVRKNSFVNLGELGITLAALTEKIRKRFNLRWESRGVVVSIIDKEAAPSMGLVVGDVIVQVNQEPVWDPAQVDTMIEQARAAERKAILMLIESVNGYRFILMPIELGE